MLGDSPMKYQGDNNEESKEDDLDSQAAYDDILASLYRVSRFRSNQHTASATLCKKRQHITSNKRLGEQRDADQRKVAGF